MIADMRLGEQVEAILYPQSTGPDGNERLTRAWSKPARWGFFTEPNNTWIGLLYIGTAFFFFLVAGVLAVLMRIQLAVPNNTFLDHATYNQVFTMHGTVMMFLFAVPIGEAFAMLLLPVLIGSRDMPSIAATNRDLQAAVAAGMFREDLYFRLGGFVITVPPLRERRSDIPLLVHDFVRRAAGRVRKDVHGVSDEALGVLIRYCWPGNVRELEHAIERAVIVARGQIILTRDLPPDVIEAASQETADDTLDLRELERLTIVRALDRFRGNRRAAASALNISPATLWRKVKHFGLPASQLRATNDGGTR